jgi:HD-GYP domain-containing protein (c-di-GMP phosphodiesterase class II)
MGLRRPQRGQLALAAWLHDVGKLFIPRSVLNCAGPLSAEEYRRLQQHPALGVFLLQAVLPPSPALDAVRCHHEQPDGRGYPDGLRGDEVPPLARALAVADCFDAMTSERSYSAPVPVPLALEALRRGAGTQFDPEAVERFAAALRRRGHDGA